MKTINTLKYFFYFVVFVGLQVILFLNLAVFNTAFCFIYIGFILLLPIEIPRVLILLIAFATGIIIDIFYNTLGIHAGASVLIAFIRPYIINFLTPRGGYDTGVDVSVFALGIRWFIMYSAILLFIHHFTLFALEVFTLEMLGITILRAIASTLFTLVVLVLLQYLFFQPKRL